MNIFFVLSIVCITLFCVLSLYFLITKKGNRCANILLGIFFALWGFEFLDAILILGDFFLRYPMMALWSEAIPLLYGPLIYFYTRTILYEWDLKVRHLIHAIPFLSVLVVIFCNYHIYPKEYQLKVLTTAMKSSQPLGVFLTSILIYAHVLGYFFYAKKLTKRAMEDIEEYYSTHNMEWLCTILNALIVVLLIAFTIGLTHYFLPTIYFAIGVPLIGIFVGVMLIRLMIKALEVPIIRSSDKNSQEMLDLKINVTEAAEIHEKVLYALEQDKLFLQPELTVLQLSRKVDFPTKKVSHVINRIFKKSFFDLINGYRISEAKKIFIENKDAKLTVLEVMYDVGFNSKSSFNTQFKKRTGITPSEFKNLHSPG